MVKMAERLICAMRHLRGSVCPRLLLRESAEHFFEAPTLLLKSEHGPILTSGQSEHLFPKIDVFVRLQKKTVFAGFSGRSDLADAGERPERSLDAFSRATKRHEQ